MKSWGTTVLAFLSTLGLSAAVVTPKATDEALVNPGMGFVHYHYSNRLWAYGSQQEPGDTLDWFPGASVIYFRLNWSTLEPEEGVFRWDVIDSYAQPWIAKGKQIAIRVMCCENRYRYSTPEWVRKAGAKGVEYACRPNDAGDWPESGEKLWEPDYTDPVFLAKLEDFLKAFARRYDGDRSVAFVDIGSFGMWGEGHTGYSSQLSFEKTLVAVKTHMDLWRRCLPNTYLVISDDVAMDNECKTDAPAMKYARKLGIGFRDDSIMCNYPPESWFHAGWAQEFAKEMPVVIETGHYNLLDDGRRWTEELFVKSAIDNRASYMSIHGWPEKFLKLNRRAIERINRILGYRLELRRVEYPETVRLGEPVTIVSDWANVGVAPCYRGATLCWTLLDARGAVVWTVTDEKSNARALPPRVEGPDSPVRFSSICHFGLTDTIPVINDGVLVRAKKELPGAFDDLKVPTLKPGSYTLAVSFGTPQGMPEIALPLEGGKGRRYAVGSIAVVGPSAHPVAARVPVGCDPAVMSGKYWALWNDAEQRRIDADIEANRKADATVGVAAPDGAEVRVEQLTHAFRFGAQGFAVGRLKTAELNRRYEENFARLFNQVTISFYWRGFETSPGDCHFDTRSGDREEAFTSGEREKMDPHVRYLASPSRSTDQYLDFAKRHGMVVHGHPLVWGTYGWMIPFWLYDEYCPENEKAFLQLPRKDPNDITRLFAEWDWYNAYKERIKELFERYSEEEIAAKCPVYLANMKRLWAERVARILDYCGDRVDSWDVVNESSGEFEKYGSGRSGKPMFKSNYGLMPADYPLDAFLTAMRHVSAHPKLAINDNQRWETYRRQVDDLVAHGARVDMVGVQYHIFQNEKFLQLVAGEKIGWPYCSTPADFRGIFDTMGGSGRPVNLSEITIPSPGGTSKAKMQQAIAAVNFYRLWFSHPKACGITWWHTLDGADKSGGSENGWAGLMDAEANPKPVYGALYDLIHRQWKTSLTARAVGGKVSFRGFRGHYRLTWKDASGQVVSSETEVE